MKRLFGKSPKKSPKPSPKHISLRTPVKIAPGSLGFRAKLDIGPDGVHEDDSGEDKELPTPEASISGVAVVGTDPCD
ncbi:hypothetical protein BDM02DRAFT_3190896 [Thelephora ganbajun]|uniref:Uncharacterized protein n=1 Tax=Thelephora ganbajun TaxID=370292 RepID=A0ACB6Z3J1_THEGA|nr:hypothetical protein BDM02DRAFT_3190896 [Thelephora ganbajun]